MDLDLSVAELLEQEEKKADAKARAAAKDKESDSGRAPAPSRDPRRGGRHGGDERSSKSNRYSVEREENNERRSRRSKDLAEDDEVKGDSEKGSANGSVPDRDRRRSRSPGRHSRRPSHDDDDHGRHRQHARGGDFWQPSDRDDPHHRPRSRYDERPLTRDQDRNRGGRSRSPHRGPRPYRRDREDDVHESRRGGRRSSPPRSRKAKTPEPTDDERDRRTVFVQQLAARLRTKELQAFFEQVGPVVEAQIVKDRVSGRSKGVGYVEFKDEESVQKAIQLTGQKLVGIPIIAQLTEAEKNRQARTTEGAATQSNGVPFHRLYVGNIHFSITEDDLKDVFEPFGELEFVQLQKEEQGRSKGYGFVQFIDPAQAKEALEKMNGFELAGRPIRVGLGNDKFTPESTQSLLQRFGSQQQQAAFQGSSFSGSGGRGAHAGGTGGFDRPGGRDADRTGGASALDDTDVAGVNYRNYDRLALMDKLARKDTQEPKIALKAQQKQPPPVSHVAPTRCVLLKNVYEIAKEADKPNWQKELEEDVRSECDQKYGHVVHIGIAPGSSDGEIYIKFDRVQGGENAIRGLNGRYFGGLMITAQYVVDAVYNMNFPKAQNL